MLITYTAHYRATGMEDAVRTATALWREFVQDGTAELPWGATLSIENREADAYAEEGNNVELRISTDYSARTA